MHEMTTYKEDPDGRIRKRLEDDGKSFLDPGNTVASHRVAAINNKNIFLRGQGRGAGAGAGSWNQFGYIFHPLGCFNQNMILYIGFSRRNRDDDLFLYRFMWVNRPFRGLELSCRFPDRRSKVDGDRIRK